MAEKGVKGAIAFAKRIVEVLSPLIFSVGYQEHQAAKLVLIIASLYSYNWIQQVIKIDLVYLDIRLPAVQSLGLEGFFPALALFCFMLFVLRF